MCDKSKPGRPPKRKAHHQRPHAPTSSTPTATTSHSTDNISLEKESGMDVSMDGIEQRAMPAYKANLDLDRERFFDKNVVLIYKICLHAADKCVEIPCCTELYCCPCICDWLQCDGTCPTCSKPLQASNLLTPQSTCSADGEYDNNSLRQFQTRDRRLPRCRSSHGTKGACNTLPLP